MPSAPTTAKITRAGMRNCRQVSQIIGVPPGQDGCCGRQRWPGSCVAWSSRLVAADPPEAEARQQQGDGEEDPRLAPLQRPEVAGRVVGHSLPVALVSQPGEARLARLRGL